MDDSIIYAIKQLVREEVVRIQERAPEPPNAPSVLVVSTEVLPGGRLLPIREAAHLLGMSRDWVYDQIKAGELATVNLGTTKTKRRIEATELARFVRTFRQ